MSACFRLLLPGCGLRAAKRVGCRVSGAMGRLTLCSVLTFAVASRGQDGAPEPVPTITRKEAGLLETVSSLASTNLAEAIRVLEQTDVAGASPAVDCALGNFLFQAGRLDQAAVAYEAALVKMPTFRQAAMNLGRVYLLLDRPGKTVEIYQGLMRQGPMDGDVLMLLGHALLMERHAVSAESAYRQALLLRPADTDAKLGLAKSLLEQDRVREALHLIGEVLDSDVRRPELWSLRANAHLVLDEPERAMVSIETARRLGLAGGDLLSMLGDLYLNAGRVEDASRAYGEALATGEARPDRLLRAAEAFALSGEAERAGKLADSVENAAGGENALSEDARLDLLKVRGAIAEARGDAAAAMVVYRRFLSRRPADAEVLLRMGDLHAAGGDPESALVEYERAARVRGFEAQALIRQARVEVDRKRYKRAVELLDASLRFEDRTDVRSYRDKVKKLEQESAAGDAAVEGMAHAGMV